MATLRVWFSGLCQFIDSKVPDDNGLCVVLVKAAGHSAAVHKLDWNNGVRYRPLVNPPIAYLRDVFLTFRIQYGSGGAPAQEPDFDEFGLVQLEDMAGDFAEGDADITNYDPSTPTKDKVVAQVFMPVDRRGSLRNRALVENWELPDTINQEFRRSMEVADPVFFEVHNVASVDLVITPFGQETPIYDCPITLTGNLYEIIVVNNCDAGGRLLELRIGETDIRLVQIDRDFREHFKMLNENAMAAIRRLEPIKAKGGDAGLPAPEKTIFLFSGLRGIPVHWRNTRRQFEVGKDESLVDPLLEVMDSLALDFHDVFQGGVVPLLKNVLSGFGYLVFREFVRGILLKLEPFGAGVGSGCDCLPCGGRPQFFETPSIPQRSELTARPCVP
jgi:hypothetical protein